MKLFDLSDRVALITGGNGGNGFGMAEGLAGAGAAVVIAGRDEAKNAAAVGALRQAGAKAEAVPVDMANEMSCRNMVASAVATFGRLDVLVNNAGIGVGKRPEEFMLSEWNIILATNLTGVLARLSGRLPRNEASRRRQNYKRRVDVLDLRRSVYGCLRGKQGWGRPTYEIARDRLGVRQHSSQCGAPGLDRHRSYAPGSRA
jgi:NAD(P)-dependent dehydrogenase (short-subunit alcohol dehydrogenase family)